MELTIRTLEPLDYPLLEDFLYHAIFVPPGAAPPPQDVIYKPELSVYIDGFGGRDDFGLLALKGGRAVGAAWARLIQAYGYVDDDTPELAIAVLPGHRNEGIGTSLLTSLLALLCERGYGRVSLSVEKANPALHLYQRLGFKTVNENNGDFIMLKEFPPERMADFFNTRAEIYDDHMNVDMALDEFYQAVADLIAPPRPDFHLLDLGCGTGLELERLFESYPDMRVTGIDLAQNMLDKLQGKYPDKPMQLICGSYFNMDFGSSFDIVLSTYSLHHFDEDTKRELYQRIHAALKPGGFFLFGDFTAPSREQQDLGITKAAQTQQENKLSTSECYHLDMPFTAQTEIALMKDAGFNSIHLTHQWPQASIITARA